MARVAGTYRRGRVILNEPVDWPDGAEVVVEGASGAGGVEDIGTTAEVLARWDALEPPELTPEEEAGIAAAREAVRRASVAAVRKRMDLGP